MANYLGFPSTEKPNYFFLSYNSEDAKRISHLAKLLAHNDVAFWYDDAIEYGEKWEVSISKKMQNAQAVVLFFTKGILYKQNSYVYKEYKMATEYFDKKVYVIIMDNIKSSEVPYDKVPWWIDIQERQCMDISNKTSIAEQSAEILKALGLSSHEEKMNSLIKKYNELYINGKEIEAESFLSDYLKGQTLAGKAKCIANLSSGKMNGFTLLSSAVSIPGKLDHPLPNHQSRLEDVYWECCQLQLNDCVFTFGFSDLFSRSTLGDVYLFHFWRDDELVYTYGAVFEVSDIKIHYDALDDIIYVTYRSRAGVDDNRCIVDCISVFTIEDACKDAKCNHFPRLLDV